MITKNYLPLLLLNFYYIISYNIKCSGANKGKPAMLFRWDLNVQGALKIGKIIICQSIIIRILFI